MALSKVTTATFGVPRLAVRLDKARRTVKRSGALPSVLSAAVSFASSAIMVELSSPPSEPPVVALVDDDRNILTSVSIALQAEGFLTRVYLDGESALSALRDRPADLVVSDIKMPRMDGLEFVRQLRATSAIPVIFLTSRDDEMDEALGLAIGADDYIAKPFSQRLLVARIRALLRRAKLRAAPDHDDPEHTLLRGALAMDSERQRVSWQGQEVVLTVTEFLVLQVLAQRPGVVRSRAQLMDAAYKDDGFADDRTIDSHVKRLRRKFRSVDPDFDAIHTVYGAGYRFDA